MTFKSEFGEGESCFLEVRYGWMLRVSRTKRGLKNGSKFVDQRTFPLYTEPPDGWIVMEVHGMQKNGFPFEAGLIIFFASACHVFLLLKTVKKQAISWVLGVAKQNQLRQHIPGKKSPDELMEGAQTFPELDTANGAAHHILYRHRIVISDD